MGDMNSGTKETIGAPTLLVLIAVAADIAPRTFFAYFPSQEA